MQHSNNCMRVFWLLDPVHHSNICMLYTLEMLFKFAIREHLLLFLVECLFNFVTGVGKLVYMEFTFISINEVDTATFPIVSPLLGE